jgi:flagellin
MQVYNNSPAFSVWKNYTASVTGMRKSMSKLSSGLKIEGAGDDPAGLAMSERLRAQYRNAAAAANNIENQISYLQTSDSWLQKIHDILGRMAELAVAANDGTKATTDRNNLQQEFKQMQLEIRRITTGTSAAAKYNGSTLFQGQVKSLQVGPDYGQNFTSSSIELTADMTSASTTDRIGTWSISTASGTASGSVSWGSIINTAHVSISVQSLAGKAVGKINVGVDYISQKRAIVGAQQSRLTHTLEGLRAYEDNIRASESRIRDVDIAKETTAFSKYQILTQIGTAMLAQANALPQGVVSLVR